MTRYKTTKRTKAYLKRPCKKCSELFAPTGPYSWQCKKCDTRYKVKIKVKQK